MRHSRLVGVREGGWIAGGRGGGGGGPTSAAPAQPQPPSPHLTRWRTVADHKRKLYFFESALTPNTFWVDLKDIDFSKETGKVLRLDLGPDQRNVFAGNTVKDFRPAEPFVFQGL